MVHKEAERAYTHYLLPVLLGVVFLAFNAWYTHRFYHVNSFKLLYMALMLTACFVIYDVSLVIYRRRQRASGAAFAFPWKEALLYLLPVFATFPGFFLHINDTVSYNLNYELATRLIILLWVVYIVRFLNSDADIRLFLIFVGLTMCMVLVLAVIERFGLAPSVLLPGEDNRARVTYGNPNYLAGALAPIMPLFFALLLPAVRSARSAAGTPPVSHSAMSGTSHWYFLLFFVLSGVTLVWAGSRAAFGVTVLACSAVGVVLLHSAINPARKKSRTVWYSIACGGGVALVLVALITFRTQLQSTSRLFNVFDTRAWIDRLVPWGAAWEAFKEAPVFGYGLGSSYSLFFQFVSPTSRNIYALRSYNHAHSEWLEYLTEGGIFGYVFFFVLWGYVISRLVRIFRASNNLFHKRLALGIIAGVSAYFLHGLFSVVQRMVVTQVPLYALLGIAFVLIRSQNGDGDKEKTPRFTRLNERVAVFRSRFNTLPAWVKNQLPVACAIVCIGVLYIPWARTQAGYVELTRRPVNSAEEQLKVVEDLTQLTDRRQDIYALETLMNLQYRLGLRAEALRTFAVIEKTVPNYRSTRFVSSLVSFDSGDKEIALERLEQYLQSDTCYIPALSFRNFLAIGDRDITGYAENLSRIASCWNWKETYRQIYQFSFAADPQQDRDIVVRENDDQNGITITLSADFVVQRLMSQIVQIINQRSDPDRRKAAIEGFQDFLYNRLLHAAIADSYVVLEPRGDIQQSDTQFKDFRDTLFSFARSREISNGDAVINNWSEVQKKALYFYTFVNNYGRAL